jgi:hypothetical protein
MRIALCYKLLRKRDYACVGWAGLGSVVTYPRFPNNKVAP